MLIRIEIHAIGNSAAYGALVFDNGEMHPIQIPELTYETLKQNGFFNLEEEEPDGDNPINYSKVYETEMSNRENWLDKLTGITGF